MEKRVFLLRYGALFATTLGLAACAIDPGAAITNQENNLSAAGFTVLPANTPARATMLSRLPPTELLQGFEGNRVTYLYADPVVCNCLYAGGQEAFGRYQSQQAQRQIASAQLRAAQLNSDFAWQWGPWGYGGGFGYYP
jgi:hypothetical protein